MNDVGGKLCKNWAIAGFAFYYLIKAKAKILNGPKPDPGLAQGGLGPGPSWDGLPHDQPYECVALREISLQCLKPYPIKYYLSTDLFSSLITLPAYGQF